jgi:hypothetical protein
MKTTPIRFNRNKITKALAIVSLISILSAQDMWAMPFISANNPFHESATAANSPGKLRMFSYTVPDLMLLVLNMENPDYEKVAILILNKDKEIIYRKNLGKAEKCILKLNLQQLPSDNYTMVVRSARYTYSRSFSLQTHIERKISLLAAGVNNAATEHP